MCIRDRSKYRSETEVIAYARRLHDMPSTKKRKKPSGGGGAKKASTKALALPALPNPAKRRKGAAAYRAATKRELGPEDEDDGIGVDSDEVSDSASDSESDAASDSESDSDSASESEPESDSEVPDSADPYGVRVEGMLTVMDADACLLYTSDAADE